MNDKDSEKNTPKEIPPRPDPGKTNPVKDPLNPIPIDDPGKTKPIEGNTQC